MSHIESICEKGLKNVVFLSAPPMRRVLLCDSNRNFLFDKDLASFFYATPLLGLGILIVINLCQH